MADVPRSQEVERALQRAGGTDEPPAPPVEARHKLWLAGYVLLILALGVTYYLLRLHWFDFGDRFTPLVRRGVLGAMAAALVLALARAVDAYVIERSCSQVSQYNFKRILRLAVGVVLATIVVSVLFANWYAAAASLGLISLVLGFALQTPITSLIGWAYILAREPYRIGDRIRIGEHTGDVIALSYLDTTLWEVGGDYVSTDHPSGRLVKFPNANVLSNPVLNYSWSLFPYVWNEITFHVGYDCDLAFVERTMRETVEEDTGAEMVERVRHFRELLARTPVDHVQVQERPSVLFRVNPNTWIEATVRYLVDPKDAGPTKTRLMAMLLERLNAAPELTRFPKGDAR
ncbi:MAG TPA: mechanosensitive ion channel family protein [Xanthomonadaceae bacterium]|nr:mechanosensitive ion channel family protein [Xanthomonadaceae bacterium]